MPTPPELFETSHRAERAQRYAAFRAHYAGKPRALLASANRTGRRAGRNYVALLIDAAVAYIGTQTVTWGDGAEADRLEDYLNETLDREHRDALDLELETAVGVDGDGFMKITWDPHAEEVRIRNVDPSTVVIIPSPEDPTRMHAVAQQYVAEPQDYQALFGDTLTAGTRGAAVITEYWDPDFYRVYENGQPRIDQPNPYGFVPYLHIPNFRLPYDLWGTSDAARIADLQDVLNDAELDSDTRARILGLLIVITGTDGTGDLTLAPGKIWELPDGATAEILDVAKGAAVSQALDYLTALKGEMFQLARIPAAAIGTEDIKTGVSGLALQIQLGPILREVRRKRGYRSPVYEERARMVATLAARFGNEPPPLATLRPRTIWAETLPTDRGEELDNALKEVALGRSIAAVLRDIGIEDPDAEVTARLSEIRQGLVQGASHGTGQPAAAGPDAPDPADA